MTLLETLRSMTGMSQVEFAKRMGIPVRTYQDIIHGKSKEREVHRNAARWATQQHFIDRKFWDAVAEELGSDYALTMYGDRP